MTTSNVLIVGAGPSGLSALKEMREAGLNAIAVDSSSSFGGVFALDSGVTFEDLHLTISNIYMSFSDFPAQDVDKGVKYWSQAEYFEYLTRYVDHFQLEQHIRLETTVDNAHFNQQSGLWEVSLAKRLNSGEMQKSKTTFEKLIVATGANGKPKVPAELRQFKGEIIHSADYHSADQVKGKKVLVVGMGEGGADVASSAVKTAESVTVWGRRYPDCAPRFVEPFLHDGGYDEHKHMAHHRRPNGVLESLTTTRAVRNLPLGIWSVALQRLIKGLRSKHGPNSMQGMCHAFTSRAWNADYYSSDTSMVPTKSAITLTAAAKGLLDVLIAPDITIRDKTATFQNACLFGAEGNGAAAEPTNKDRYELDIDVIVACTGFSLAFDWISFSDSGTVLETNPRTWFKHCFPAELGYNLAFVGFARPHSGGIPQCSEMVSRYIAQLYIGNLKLPTDYAELALTDAAAERACFHLTPDYNVLVDYMAYMMSVAKLMDCTPISIPKLNAPLDSVKYWTFPLWPCFFRTRGVGAKPETCDAVLSKFGPFDALMPMPLLAIQLLCGIVMPFINALSWAVNLLTPQPIARRSLPRMYKWRMSKMYFLYHNSLTAEDFKSVFTQWVATVLIVAHLINKGVTSIILSKKELRTASKL